MEKPVALRQVHRLAHRIPNGLRRLAFPQSLDGTHAAKLAQKKVLGKTAASPAGKGPVKIRPELRFAHSRALNERAIREPSRERASAEERGLRRNRRGPRQGAGRGSEAR